MMALTEPKPFASLGPTLLARKGGARPAMRPQLAAAAQAPQEFAQDLEDLGWNDMGEEAAEERRETAVLALTPSPHPHDADADEPEELEELEELDEPEVLRQQRAIVAAIAEEPVAPAPAAEAPLVKVKPARRPASDSRRAAFTLRLDAARHLKLRLASTIRNRSAQALVTQALDKFLADIPEIEAMASQLERD